MPYKATIDINSLSEIKKHKSDALKRKLRFIKYSSLFLILGLLLSTGGVICKQIFK
jgi:hypothetical protein